LKINDKVQYAFRRPRFPIVCAVGSELLAAASTASVQRQIERLDLPGDKVLDIVDATGEGWAFHVELVIVSPLTLKKRWTKAAVIRLFSESNNARRIGGAYPATSLSGKTLVQVIADVAALAAYAKPNEPLRQTAVRSAAPPNERQRSASAAKTLKWRESIYTKRLERLDVPPPRHCNTIGRLSYFGSAPGFSTSRPL
jgi:hypothetical protein